MSYYYNYYIGYQKDGKLYPVGPFDQEGKLHSAITKSRSFASDLHTLFTKVSEDAISFELRAAFSYETYDHKTEMAEVKYLAEKDLPSEKLFLEGYCLIEQIERFEKEHDTDLKYDMLSAQQFLRKMENELKFGKPEKKNDGKEDPEIHTCDEYAYYRFIDQESIGFEVFLLRQFISAYEYTSAIPEGAEIVILETEG